MRESEFSLRRETMVREQLEGRGITDAKVLEAFRRVPREEFVADGFQYQAYEDRPLPIGPEQTISQPYIVARMLEELRVEPADKVLEIGTGSGYQTALLAEIAAHVYSVELSSELASKAQGVLKRLGYTNTDVRIGDGWAGWPEHAPFERIVVSAAPPSVPRELVRQLKLHGSLILPLGDFDQMLVLFHKTEKGLESREICAVRFVELKQTRNEGN